jgi:hypothetical protein
MCVPVSQNDAKMNPEAKGRYEMANENQQQDWSLPDIVQLVESCNSKWNGTTQLRRFTLLLAGDDNRLMRLAGPPLPEHACHQVCDHAAEGRDTCYTCRDFRMR